MDLLKKNGLLGLAALLAAAGVYFSATHDPAQTGYDLIAFLLAGLAFCAQVILLNHRYGTLATALLAAACNAYLFSRKFEATGESACNISQTINCDVVNQSVASELFGLPVTLYGLGFYLGLALASFGNDDKSPRFNQINGLFAIVSLLFSAYLGWEAKKIGAFCVLCITIYLCNALLMWASLRGLKSQGRSLFEGIDKIFNTSTLWAITATFAVVTLVGGNSWRTKVADSAPTAKLEKPTEPGGSFSAEQLATLYSRPNGPVKLDGTEPILGSRDAPITVVEFADYGCPHCAQASPMLKQLVHDLPSMKLIFKAFPLSGACNPALQGEEGVERCKAAMAAECAGVQGRYFELSSKLFANLGYNSDNDLAFMAKEVDLDFAKWESCMGEQTTVEAVTADAVAGFEAGVQGTPTLFVSGLIDGVEWVEVGQGPEALRALIESKMDGVQLLPPL